MNEFEIRILDFLQSIFKSDFLDAVMPFITSLFVCTHGHFDHIIGMQDLLDACGSLPVAIHPGDSCYLGPEDNT